MKQPINEIARMKKLAGLITESQYQASLDEALNKDIKAFGQDLDKNLKAAGFQTLILVGKFASDEQKKKVQTDLGLAIIEVGENQAIQTLSLYVNPKEFEKAKKVTSKFQLPSYDGAKMTFGKGWDTITKQIKGALNPGDIYDAGVTSSHGVFYFARLAKVETKTTTTSGNNTTSTPVKTATVQPKAAPAPQQESQLNEYDEYDDIDTPEFDDDHDIDAQKKFDDMIVDVPRLSDLMTFSMSKNLPVTVNGVKVISMGNTGRMTLEDGTKLNSNDFADRVPDIKIDGEPIDIPMMSSTPPAPLNYQSSNVYPAGSYMDEVVNKALREHRRKQK